MDDELEDKVFYQTYVSHMKILSKFAVGISSINSPLAYFWKLCRLYVLRPEVLICGFVLFVILLYFQAVDVWSRGLLGRIQATLGRQKANRMKLLEASGKNDHECWQEVRQQSAAFALLGRRAGMEDRFIIEENINNSTGISFFAIFDGHGGQFAADFAKDVLVKNIYDKVIEATKLLSQQQQHKKQSASGNSLTTGNDCDNGSSPYLKRKPSQNNKENKPAVAVERRNSLRKAQSAADDSSNHQSIKDYLMMDTADIFTSKLNSLLRASGGNKDSFLNNNKDGNANANRAPPPTFDAECYVDKDKIDFGKLITDEVHAADYKLVEAAKKTDNIAGTTALIAIVHASKLIVANVGDSRGVMCDSRGIAIPLSFDHKPQQVRERKRIHDAGGFIAFRGVWRVAGILATSRALGDFPLKDKNLVIATPDILTFDLNDHKPSFLILASDGLWDTFSNEEACTYIKKHLHETDFGAKSLVMESYQRGSVDNITVLVIVFRNGVYRIGNSNSTGAAKDAAVVAPLNSESGNAKAAAAIKRTGSNVSSKQL